MATSGLLVEGLALEPDFEVGVIGFGLFGLPFVIDGVGFHLWIGENQEDGIGIHFVAGLGEDPADLAVEFGLNPQNVFGDESAGTANVATMRPRRTVSIQTVERSTVGAAAWRRLMRQAAAETIPEKKRK